MTARIARVCRDRKSGPRSIFRIEFFCRRPFYDGDEGVHRSGKHAQHDRAGHHEVEVKDLTAVYDQVSQPCARDEVFAHDRSHPAQTHIDLECGDDRRRVGGEHEQRELLPLGRIHRVEQHQLAGVRLQKSAQHADDGDDYADQDRHKDDRAIARAYPNDDDRTECDLGERVEHDEVRFEHLAERRAPPQRDRDERPGYRRDEESGKRFHQRDGCVFEL